MNRFLALLISLCLFHPQAAFAETTVVEGEQAKSLYAADRQKAQTLVQKSKIFSLRMPNGSEIPRPDRMTLKAGERFYITNEEQVFVHNVYDAVDSSWVIKKQLPANVAAVTFNAPGEHVLLCAIHPAMKIKVIVTP